MNTQLNDQLFNLSYLNQAFQGNKDMINNIIKLFLDQVPEFISEMVDCVERNDLLALHPLAHKAKSSITMLGLKNMEINIVQIEQDSKYNRNVQALPNLVYQVKDECDIVFVQLRVLLSASNAA